MRRITQSLGPPLTMLGALAWLCWSHLSPTTTIEASRPKLPTLLAKRLNPELPAPPSRNPFLPVSAEAPAETAAVAEQETPAATAPPRPQPPPQPAVDLHAAARLLELSGTIVSGRRHQALINGHLYGVGDGIGIQLTAQSPRIALRVAAVEMNRVTLESDDGQILLSYGRPAEAIPRRGGAAAPTAAARQVAGGPAAASSGPPPTGSASAAEIAAGGAASMWTGTVDPAAWLHSLLEQGGAAGLPAPDEQPAEARHAQ